MSGGVFEIEPSGGDDTTIVQAAIDDAVAYGDGTSGAGEVRLAPGNYHLTDTLIWGACSISGSDPNAGVRVFWDGPGDRPAIRKVAQFSFGRLAGVNFRPGTGEPTVWLDLTDGSVDALFQLDRCHFVGGSQAAIDMAGWVNAHWTHLRFDHVGGHAIRATPPRSQYLSSFTLDGFTYDHKRTDHAGQGVIRVDNSAGASNLGVLTLRGGRIEVNSAWSGTRAIFTIAYPATAQARALLFRLDDVTYQDVVGMPDDALICRDTTNTSGNESVQVDACRFATLARFNNGPWWSGATLPTAATLNAGVGHLTVGQGPQTGY